MLKRNFVLSILVLIITVTYLTYSKPAEIETADYNNDFVDLSVINNIVTVSENLSNESLIIVNLWASWCIPCIEEVDELKDKLLSSEAKVTTLEEQLELNRTDDISELKNIYKDAETVREPEIIKDPLSDQSQVAIAAIQALTQITGQSQIDKVVNGRTNT